MEQRKILELLNEAATLGCTPVRRDEIAALFRQATFEDDGDFDGRRAGFVTVMDAVFDDTASHRPHLLPGLFPLFAVLCGDRPRTRTVLTDVDWSLMEISTASQNTAGLVKRSSEFRGKKGIILELLGGRRNWWTGLDLVKASRGRLGRGTIYVLLNQLEEQILVQSKEDDSPRSPGQLPRRLYHITDSGVLAL